MGVLLENMLFVGGWVASVCLFWRSVNEWMRKKTNGWGGGMGGLCRVGWGFEGWMGIDLLQTIDHARRGG